MRPDSRDGNLTARELEALRLENTGNPEVTRAAISGRGAKAQLRKPAGAKSWSARIKRNGH